MTYEEKMVRDVKLWLATLPGPFSGKTEDEALRKARKSFETFKERLFDPFELAVRQHDALHHVDDGFEVAANAMVGVL